MIKIFRTICSVVPYLLLATFLLFALWCHPIFAQASGGAPPATDALLSIRVDTTWTSTGCNGPAKIVTDSPAAFCGQVLAAWHTNLEAGNPGGTKPPLACAYQGLPVVTGGPLACFWNSCPPNGSAPQDITCGNVTQTYSCPNGGTLSGVGGTTPPQCTSACPAGQSQQPDGSCKPSCNAKKGKPSGFACIADTRTDPTKAPDLTGQKDGCTISFDSLGGGYVDAVGNKKLCGNGSYDGTSVGTGPPANTPPAPPERCAAGTCPGQVNNANVCVACSDPRTDTHKRTSTGPNGPTNTTITSSDDGNNKTTTVTDENGNTQTTSDNSGDPATDCDKYPEANGCKTENPIAEYCRINPTAQICKKIDDSTIGDACDNFTCTGDPIACAVARRESELVCALLHKEGAQKTLGQTILDGNDTFRNPSDTANRDLVSLPTTLDQSTFLTAGSLGVTSITGPFGSTYQMDLTFLNAPLAIMGNLLVALCFVACARYALGGV